MAIIIPSERIYSIDNPKIRDNFIERIEVTAKEVVPDNEYETPVYNATKYNSPKFGETTSMIIGAAIAQNTGVSSPFNNAISYVQAIPQYITLNIEIPILRDNHYISNLLLGVDKENKSNIKYTISGIKSYGTVTAIMSRSGISNDKVSISNIIKSKPTIENIIFEEVNAKINNPIEYGGVLNKAEANAEVTVSEGNIKEITKANKIQKDGVEYYQLEFTLLACINIIKAGATGSYDYYNQPNQDFDGTGTYEEYVPEQIEITIYGNTIGIDLTDKTVYIPETDKTSKKVFSVDGNELMQTSNYIRVASNSLAKLEEGKDYSVYEIEGSEYTYEADISFSRPEDIKGNNIIVHYYEEAGSEVYSEEIINNIQSDTITLRSGYYVHRFKLYLQKVSNVSTINNYYEKTKKLYANGKETATVRCLLSDYYEKDSNSNNVLAVSPNGKNFLDLNQLALNGKTKVVREKSNSAPYVVDILYGNATSDPFNWDYKNSDCFIPLKEGYYKIVSGTVTTYSSSSDLKIFAPDDKVLFDWNKANFPNKINSIFYVPYDMAIGVSVKLYIDKSGALQSYIENLMICEADQTDDYEPFVPMVFKEYDTVTPYVRVGKGERALSYNNDGTPKEFSVLGNKIVYDGSIVQELYLQETKVVDN